MKNVVKSSKHFFGYFNTPETHSAMLSYNKMFCCFSTVTKPLFKISCLGEFLIKQRMAVVKSKCILKKSISK